jgi:L-asparaginase
MVDNNASVLIVYTGGTIGMTEDPTTGVLKPYDFQRLRTYVPELDRLGFQIDSVQFEPPMDSADMGPEQWKRIIRTIEEGYGRYDGFVVLHGTDTMAYSASALSFLLEGLGKPVILTGSQLPVGKIRTDGKENLLTALEMAVDRDEEGKAFVQEVCVFFQNVLMRGNRTSKTDASYFNAFHSFNFPVLAEAGVEIGYRKDLMLKPPAGTVPQFRCTLDPNVAIVKIFPGISAEILRAMTAIPFLKGIVLETYGTGNVPGGAWFLDIVAEAVARGLVMVNITQCVSGSVDMRRYPSGRALEERGVLSGGDMTTEAAVAKLMYLFGRGFSGEEVRRRMGVPLAGEMTAV